MNVVMNLRQTTNSWCDLISLIQFSVSLNGPGKTTERIFTHLEKYPFEIRNQSTHTMSYRAFLLLFCSMPLTIVYEGISDGCNGL